MLFAIIRRRAAVGFLKNVMELRKILESRLKSHRNNRFVRIGQQPDGVIEAQGSDIAAP